MDPAVASVAAPTPVVFRDGLGERKRIADPTGKDALDVLCLNPELTAVPSFEFALRERVSRLSGFRHPYFGYVRGVDRLSDPDATLALMSDATPGTRLSDVLAGIEQHGVPLDISSALCLIRQLVPAIAMLHDHERDAAHGALAPERIVLTSRARLVIVEYTMGAALEQLRYSHQRYWKDLRIALPRSAGLPRFDQRVDVTQIGVVALTLILGRPLHEDEYPSRVPELVASAWATSSHGDLEPLPARLRAWLVRALQLDLRTAFTSVAEAASEFDKVLSADTGYLAEPAALDAFLVRYHAAVPQTGVAAPAATPRPPVSASGPAASAMPPATAPSYGSVPRSPLTDAPPATPASPSYASPAPSFAAPAPAVDVTRFAAAPTSTPERPVVSQPLFADPPTAPAAAPFAPLPSAPPAAPRAPYAPTAAGTQAPAVGSGAVPPVWPAAASPASTIAAPSTTATPEPTFTHLASGSSNYMEFGPDALLDEEEDEDEPTRGAGTPPWMPIAAGVLGIVLLGGAFFAYRHYRGGSSSAVATGTLTVTTNPAGAQLVVDGQNHGVTPLTVSLSAGAHTLELRGPAGTRSIPVTIQAGTQSSQYIELASAVSTTGSLLVRTEPAGARVSIDGISRGTSPVTVADLAPGDHAVVLTGDTSVTQTVNIEPGVTASLVVTLGNREGAPLSGWVSVTAPVDMQLFEGGRLLGSSQTDRIMVTAGNHQIDLVNDTIGYRATRSVQVTPGRVSPIVVKLPMGTIALNAIPWAEVWIDGEKIGETPIGNLQIAIGSHDVVFRNPELGEQHHPVLVTLTSPARVSVDMRKK